MNGTGEAHSVAAGHRVVPHTADLIVEAWAPSKGECLEQAVLALVESFAELRGVDGDVVTVPFAIEARSDDEQVVALLEEVIYLLDTRGVVPVGIQLTVDDEGMAGSFDTVPAEAVELVGAVPKGVSRHALELGRADAEGGWRCRALIDV